MLAHVCDTRLIWGCEKVLAEVYGGLKKCGEATRAVQGCPPVLLDGHLNRARSFTCFYSTRDSFFSRMAAERPKKCVSIGQK